VVAGAILAPSSQEVLRDLAARRLLLAFDYDGVLAPLGPELTGRDMPPRTRRLLARLARRYPVAVISGRGWRDLRGFVTGAGVILVGNHGFELGRPVPVPRAVLRDIRGWTRELGERLAGVPGWHFEHKRSTFSVHYGLAPRRRAVEAAVRRAGRALRGVRLVHGKNVLNVIPAGFPGKGDAVTALLRRGRLDTALFLGDDVTDEDAFAVGPPRVVGVKVGPGPTVAPWRIRRQEQVDELLELLVELRGARRRPARRRRP
jgi:trehalose 6-phosphate phosphatase